MKRYIFIAMTAIFAIFISACGGDNAENNQDIKELVHEYTIGDFTGKDISASINSHELIIQEKGKERVYELPKDEFFVSIAPFKSYTHECAIHSLTGCQGELVEENFHVTVTRAEGEIIIDEEMKTFANGFIDLWLPRDEKFEVTIEQAGQVARQEISTFKGDYTCITTMQLASK